MRAVAALFAALFTALSEPVLHGPRVADLLAGNAGDHHDLLLGEFREPLHQQQISVEWFSPLTQSVRSRRIFLARTSLISRCLGTG